MRPKGKAFRWIFILLLGSMLASAPGGFVMAETDVTDDVDLIYSNKIYNRQTGQTTMDVALQNVGSDPIEGPVKVIINSVSIAGVTVLNADGSDNGKPFFLYDVEIAGGNLNPGATSQNIRWRFNDPSRARFTLECIIISSGGPKDKTSPKISITNPVQNSVISTSTPTITFEFSDEDSGIDPTSFFIQVDSVDWTSQFAVSESGAHHLVATPLTSGNHSITAGISDKAGNNSNLTSGFQVASSTQDPKYIFSVKDNDWVFSSPGDGTYSEFAQRTDLGMLNYSDLLGVSQVYTDEKLYFSLRGQGGLLQSPMDGTSFVFLNNSQLGLLPSDQVTGVHVGIDGSSYFSVEGRSNVLKSEGLSTYSVFMQNAQLGLLDSTPVDCLHIGYDNTVYFCAPDGQSIRRSPGDGTNAHYLSLAELGVPGSKLDGFAILPETVPPTIKITYPGDGVFLNSTSPNITITFSDNQSGIDPNSFHAELNGQNVTASFNVNQTGASYQIPAVSPLPVGGNLLTASIADRVGNVADAKSSFTVGILRAIPSATPTSGPAPLAVHFTTDGIDPGGTIVIFRWDFDGNGTWDTYDTVAQDYNRTYSQPGVYNAILYVQSSTGKTATATIAITVLNNPPVANADVGPSNGQVPLTVTFTGSGTDTDGSIVLYEWDFDGDGIYDYSSNTSGNTTHTYTTEGVYNAVFRVTDNNGLTTIAHVVTTVVRAGPPGSPSAKASASPITGNAPLNVSFSGSATDPDNNIVLYEWDFDGDGTFDWSSPSPATASFTYTQAGTHVASLRVTDETGLTGIDQILITVNIQTGLTIGKDTIGFIDVGEISASASSQYSATYPPSRAIDGNSSTYWYSSSAKPVYFEVMFSRLRRVTGFTVDWYSTSYKISRGRVELYDQLDNLLYSVEIDLVGDPSQVSLPPVDNVKRLRLVGITSTTYIRIYEFQVDSTIMPEAEREPIGTNVNSTITADTPVTILILDANGNVVRTLLNNDLRTSGAYSDYWDCRDDNGIVVTDGVYYAVMQYIVDGQVKTLDLTGTTGGTRYDFPIGTGCNTRSGNWTQTFNPFNDQQVGFQFTLCSAQEVTLFIGPLYTGVDQTRIRTILNRQVFPAGTHTVYWDGLDDNGNVATAPAGDSLITGAWRYSLANNAMVMTGGRPEISNIAATPNYYSPFSEKCDNSGRGEGVVINYTLSESVDKVELRVYSVENSSLLRIITVGGASAGDNSIFWDGKNSAGEYVAIGDYRIGITASDQQNNVSLFRYALVRIDY
jgi:PKD repeat protein